MLTCDGLVSHPGGVKDSHPLNTAETRDNPLIILCCNELGMERLGKDLALAILEQFRYIISSAGCFQFRFLI